MGAWAGEVYQDYGAVVTTVCDSTTAVHNPEGLDIKALRKHYEDDSAKLCDFSGGESGLLHVWLHLMHISSNHLFSQSNHQLEVLKRRS